MRVGMNFFRWISLLFSGRPGGRQAGQTLVLLGLSLVLGMPLSALALPQSVEVRNLGISRVGERTMLTVILNQAANPQLSPYTGADRSQLVIDFPQAQAAALPATLAGDETLVKSVKTEVSPAGVKIILEMVPNRPYIMSREITPLKGKLAMFRLNLRADTTAAAQPPEPYYPSTSPAPSSRQVPVAPPEPQAAPPAPYYPPSPSPEAGSVPATGEFAELYQLVPQARGLWDFLRQDGWTVARSQNFASPGQKTSRSFSLTNPRYPEMRVRVAHLVSAGPGVPDINIIDLSMDGLSGVSEEKYRQLQKWSFSQIRSKFEDIGDFFEDALKPLREDIRRDCQRLARRHAQFITDYVRRAVPARPGLAEQAMSLINRKVNTRFEGVQDTLSDNPLTILNLVDFTYIRVYYLGR
uniref:AMIN domain-containing protein n=1 Tax=Desulfobacca acetoxidans TaxID=60893 RepID=A0A7V6DP57_9BACT